MPTYTIHAPPPKAGEQTSDPQRFLFVRDGFYFWAFLLGPLWLLYRRLWLVLLGYVVVGALLGGLFYVVHAPWYLKSLGSLLLALLVGFEAASLRRWTLTRRGWRTLGFVVGDDEENAERRFFAAWTERAKPSAPSAPSSAAPEPQYAAPVRRGLPSGSDVIGLFPEPGQ
jgi:Protein of unknown function (DUF2628)